MSSTIDAAFVAALHAKDLAGVRALLDAHASLRERIDETFPGLHFGATPLLTVARHLPLVDLLLEYGARIDQRSYWWAGSFGVLDNDDALVDALIARGATIDVHAAARHGLVDRLRALLDADPELVHSRGGDGQTPLHVAKTVEIAALLLDRGAAIDAKDIDHESTAAQYLVTKHPDVARYLVSRGCHTDLLLVAALGDLARVRQHLDENPASIAMRVDASYFPMHDARAGGTIYIWTLGGHKTAHALAREHKHDDVFALLMQRSAPSLQLAVALYLHDDALVQELLARHPDLMRALALEDAQQLIAVAESNGVSTLRRMLAIGWPAGVTDVKGVTALHWASWHGNAAAVALLLQHGAPVSPVEHEFHATPLGWAGHGSRNSWHRQRGDYAAVVEALFAAGADPREVPEDSEATDAVMAVVRRRREGGA